MTAADQLPMFEPEGSKLVELVAAHSRTADFELRRAQNLALSGFFSASVMCAHAADRYAQNAATCEMALQFEQLAGLS